MIYAAAILWREVIAMRIISYIAALIALGLGAPASACPCCYYQVEWPNWICAPKIPCSDSCPRSRSNNEIASKINAMLKERGIQATVKSLELEPLPGSKQPAEAGE
jgi:hypothetical protein